MLLDSILHHNWDACMECVPTAKILDSWSLPTNDFLKFNVNGAARGKLGVVDIRVVLHSCKAGVIFMFSKHMSIKDINEMEVLAVSEGFKDFLAFVSLSRQVDRGK